MRLRRVAGSVLVLAFGCSPPSAKDVAKETAAEVSNFTKGAVSAVSSLNGLEALSLMTKGVSTATTGQSSGASSISINATTYDPQIDALSTFLTDKVFTEANVESTEGGATIFLLKGDDLCAQQDSTCIDQVTRIQVRIKVTSPGSGAYDFTLLIGPDRAAPLVFRIRKDQSLAFQVDLAQTKVAAAHVSTVVGQSVQLPNVAEGVLQLKLEKTGAHAFTLSESVLAAVHVEMVLNGSTYTFTTAVADPLSAVSVDGDARRLLFALALGETEISVPYFSLAPCSSSTCSDAQKAPLTIHLGGASYSLDVASGQTEFVIAHLGLGDVQSWVDYGGTHIFAGDLNALNGRHFDLGLKADADGLPIISVIPQLDLTAKFNLAALAPTGATIASWVANETYTFKLDGSPTLKPVSGVPGASSGALKLISGTLRLSTDKAGVDPVGVSAGQCLTASSSAPDGGHPLLGLVHAGACP